MIGNVYEWLYDWYQADYYDVSPNINPKGPDSGVFKAIRGGSWAELKEKSRSAIRFGQIQINVDSDFGFRIARDADN
jgi:formylglycine-generating enzyme required for sulfatase activity